MPFDIRGSAHVEGVRETLAVLKQADKKMERQVKAAMRKAAKPVQTAIQSHIPSAPPLSGWTSGRYGFDPSAARAGVKIKVGGRASSKRSTWPLLAVEQRNAGGAVFDIAGRRSSGNTPQGAAFIRVLNQRFGPASRSMWRGAEDSLDEVQEQVIAGLEDAAKQINRTIRRV
jgi:hypothetical protein